MISQNLLEHPPSLTGANCQNSLSVSIDYLRVVLPISRSDFTLDAISLLLREYICVSLDWLVDKPFFCGRYFAHGSRTECNSCVVGYNWSNDGTGELMLQISGSLLSRLDLLRQHEFMSVLRSIGAHCTRIDFAIDDYSKTLFTFENLRNAVESGNFSGARLDSYQVSSQGDSGWKVTIGKRSNSRFCRFYNKFVESKGKVDAYRFETEYKDSYAKDIFNSFCDLEPDLVLDFCSQLLGGSVDFIDRSLGDRASRCQRLAWWENFIQILGGALRWSVPRIVRTVEKTIKWVEKQVVSSLAVIRECIGIDCFEKWLQDSIESGFRRFKSPHFNRIENYSLESRLVA